MCAGPVRDALLTEFTWFDHVDLESVFLISLFSCKLQDLLTRESPPTMGWALPHLSLIKKRSQRLVFRKSG